MIRIVIVQLSDGASILRMVIFIMRNQVSFIRNIERILVERALRASFDYIAASAINGF